MVIIGQAANLYLVTMGGLSGTVPIIEDYGGGHGAGVDPTSVTDPLVQALVLTAIVIGLGTTAFALVLTYRLYQEHGTIDLLELGNGSRDDGGKTPRSVTDGGESGDRVEDQTGRSEVSVDD